MLRGQVGNILPGRIRFGEAGSQKRIRVVQIGIGSKYCQLLLIEQPGFKNEDEPIILFLPVLQDKGEKKGIHILLK